MKKLVAAILATAAFTGSANAATIVNGSFETASVNPGSGFATLGNGSTAINGWTVGGSIDYIGGYWAAQDGGRSVDLAGTSLGSVSQMITDLVNGQAYRVSYWVSKNPDGGANTRTGTVTIGNAQSTFTFSAATPGGAGMVWEQRFFDFVANGSSGTLSFAADASAGCCFGPALDNVSITAVPEPATWAMMIAGIGLVGATMRRRRTTLQFA